MRHVGFSLLELLIVLVIGSILLTLAAPAFSTSVLNARRTADVNAFVATVHLARSESAKRSVPVTLCGSADGRSCAGSFDAGWLVIAEDDPGTPLAGYQPVMHGSIRSNRARFVFRPGFGRGTNGTVVFCDQRGAPDARAVVVSYTGRPRVTATNASGNALTCAN